MAPKTKPALPPLVGVRTAANYLGLSVRSTQNLIVAGLISASKPNGGRTSAYFMTREELERFERDEKQLVASRRDAARVARKSARARKAAAK